MNSSERSVNRDKHRMPTQNERKINVLINKY